MRFCSWQISELSCLINIYFTYFLKLIILEIFGLDYSVHVCIKATFYNKDSVKPDSFPILKRSTEKPTVVFLSIELQGVPMGQSVNSGLTKTYIYTYENKHDHELRSEVTAITQDQPVICITSLDCWPDIRNLISLKSLKVDICRFFSYKMCNLDVLNGNTYADVSMFHSQLTWFVFNANVHNYKQSESGHCHYCRKALPFNADNQVDSHSHTHMSSKMAIHR